MLVELCRNVGDVGHTLVDVAAEVKNARPSAGERRSAATDAGATTDSKSIESMEEVRTLFARERSDGNAVNPFNPSLAVGVIE